jgi:hypothetical protein
MFGSAGHSRRWTAVAVAIGAAVAASAVIGVPLAVAGPATTNVTRAISSISIKGFPLPATPTITVTGKSFGKAPTKGTSPSTFANCGGSGTGFDYGPSKLWLLDASRSSGAGLLGAFQEGANATKTYGDCGGIIISSWSSTQVVFTLGSGYAAGSTSLKAGDEVCVEIKGLPGCTKLS